MDSSPVSHEEYCAFYAMDRALYTILAIELWRNPLESMQIVALWIWFERLGFRNLVQKILSLPRVVINDLADEALVCYRCIRDPQFLHSAKTTDIPLTHRMLKGEISLEYFHVNRDTVIGGIHSVVAEVCATALADVIGDAIKRHSAHKLLKKQKNTLSSPAFDHHSLAHSFANLGFVNELPKSNNSIGKSVLPVSEQPLLHSLVNIGFAGEIAQGSSSSRGIWAAPPSPDNSLCHHTFSDLGIDGLLSNSSAPANVVTSALQLSLNRIFAKMGLAGHQLSGSVLPGNSVHPRPAPSMGHSLFNLGLRDELCNSPAQTIPGGSSLLQQSLIHHSSFPDSRCGGRGDIFDGRFGGRGDIFDGMSITRNGSAAATAVAAENRTLFVTFSKGYPVTEAEVREFFTKLFGECIESFYMQPVMPPEQALYARVVFCKPDIIDLVLNGLQKAKYTINGKHLWMRKFIAKRADKRLS